MAGTGLVVAGGLVRRVVVFVMPDLRFLLWRSWCDRGLTGVGETAILLQFFNLQLSPVLSAVDVLHGVVVVDERDADKHPIEHPLPCARVAEVSFPGAVVAVGRRSTVVLAFLL